MEKRNHSIVTLVGLSVLLSMAALIAAAAAISSHSTTIVKYSSARTAAPHVATALQTVRIVMRDPGCHWFQAGKGFKRTMNVKGPVKLMNFDEAAIKVVGPAGTRIEKIGAPLRLSPGIYRITMVGQASDDNHLRLTVRS